MAETATEVEVAGNERVARIKSARDALNNLVANLSYGENYMMTTFRQQVEYKMMPSSGLQKYEAFNNDIKVAMEAHGLSTEDAAMIHKLDFGLNPGGYSDEQLSEIERIIGIMQDIYFDLSAKGYSDNELGVYGEVARNE